MNLVDGKVIDTKECDGILDTLEDKIAATLSKSGITSEAVINACDRLVSKLDLATYLPILDGVGIDRQTGEHYITQAKQMFNREALKYRLETELGGRYSEAKTFVPQGANIAVTEQICPFGVLLHIAAGNADALPAFSVLEGLLTGNINILKLPELDGGISIQMLSLLIEEEPMLAEYIYVFDYSSKDISSMEKLIDVADAVVVWGGDIAVSSLRKMIKPHTKLIEWGHKVSFGYVTAQGMTEEKMIGLAKNICKTNQLLCSSCQGVYIDTDNMETIFEFCEKFLPVLDRMAAEIPLNAGIGVQSQVTLQLYNEELETGYKGSRIFRGDSSSLIAYSDSALEAGIQFRNCWVRPLLQENILKILRPHKNHMQTVALLCGEDEFAPISDVLSKTGIVRITSGENMSETYCGAAHDGEMSLRRYTKILSFETM